MSTLFLTMLAVVVGDQLLKVLLRRLMGPGALSLGPFGSVRLSAGQLWMHRVRGPARPAMLWAVWLAAAGALIIVSTHTPSSQVFAGLLLGGSLSNAMESSLRGAVSDYVCLRFWPSFNLADLALTVGAVGTVIELLMSIRGAVT